MIKESTINQVFEVARVEDIVGQFVQLKKTGANYKGMSPFVNEKTPSFVVSPAKQIYKCFASGKGGRVVDFLMSYKNLTFPEAIEYLAAHYNIQVERDTKEVNKEEIDHVEALNRCLMASVRQYQKRLWDGEENPAMVAMHNRMYTKDTLLQWGIGYAPDEWRFLTDKLIPAGQFELARELGLTAHKNTQNFDVMRNRVIFPIHNHRGQLVAVGGRDLGETGPKYLNSPETKLYNKSAVLYGLHHAAKAIREADIAYMVEGYTDVISMHQQGVANTVAACGTGITEHHLKLLKRYTKNIALLTDADDAGERAALKTVPLAIKLGLTCSVIRLPNNEDPDSYSRKFTPGEAE